MDFGKYIGGREDVMLDKRKIRLMTRAAIMKKTMEKKILRSAAIIRKIIRV